MRADRLRWEQRYHDRLTRPLGAPSQLVTGHQHLIPPGFVLDVAAGDGRNAIYLARRGHPMVAVDISLTGLSKAAAIARAERLDVQFIQADLDDFPIPRQRFVGVLNVRFLQRALFEPLKAALLPGGVIICETFLIEQRFIGHPTNPAHLLQHGEMAASFEDFEILVSEEGRFDTEDGPAFLARLVARRPRGRD
jgi:SAM-dependent methyltransferase